MAPQRPTWGTAHHAGWTTAHLAASSIAPRAGWTTSAALCGGAGMSLQVHLHEHAIDATKESTVQSHGRLRGLLWACITSHTMPEARACAVGCKLPAWAHLRCNQAAQPGSANSHWRTACLCPCMWQLVDRVCERCHESVFVLQRTSLPRRTRQVQAILPVPFQSLASSTWHCVPAAGYAGGNHQSTPKVSGWAKLRMARQLQLAGKAALVSTQVLRSMSLLCL